MSSQFELGVEIKHMADLFSRMYFFYKGCWVREFKSSHIMPASGEKPKIS